MNVKCIIIEDSYYLIIQWRIYASLKTKAFI